MGNNSSCSCTPCFQEDDMESQVQIYQQKSIEINKLENGVAHFPMSPLASTIQNTGNTRNTSGA